MKRLIMTACVLASCYAIARPGPFRHASPPRHFHHLPPPHHYHYHYHHSCISPWVGLIVGTFVGAAIANSVNNTVVVQQPVVAAPVVTTPIVTAPVVVQPTQVWIEGRYVDQVQPNGSVLRVWVPGHYETR